MIPLKEDILEAALNRLPSQFQGKEVISKLIDVYISKVEEVDEDLHYLLNNRGVYDAIGALLDQIGNLVGVPRNGQNDDVYRNNILAKIAINNGEGTPDDVLLALKSVTQGSVVKLWEHFPATSYVMTDGDVTPIKTVAQIKESSPAGVNLRLIHNKNGSCNIPVDITNLGIEPNGYWLPEFNDGPIVTGTDLRTDLLEINSSGTSNMTINSLSQGRLLLDYFETSEFYQGILPEIYPSLGAS